MEALIMLFWDYWQFWSISNPFYYKISCQSQYPCKMKQKSLGQLLRATSECVKVFLFECYNRLMLGSKVLFIATLVILTSSLHLRTCMLHTATTSSQLSATLQNTLSQLSALNSSIDQTVSSLNPYSQTDRISSLEGAIISARKQLIQVHQGCSVPLSSQQYYCQSVPSTLSNNIKASLDGIDANADQLGKIASINNGSSSLNGLPAAITATDNGLKTSLKSPGTVVSSAPGEVNQPNFLAEKWALGGQSISDLAAQNQPKLGQNTNICPIEKPFIDRNNQCIGCSNYYNTLTKSCFDCKSYDQVKHTCNDAPISNTANQTTNGTSGSTTSTGSNTGTSNNTQNGTSPSGTSNPDNTASTSGTTTKPTNPTNQATTNNPTNQTNTSNPTNPTTNPTNATNPLNTPNNSGSTNQTGSTNTTGTNGGSTTQTNGTTAGQTGGTSPMTNNGTASGNTSLVTPNLRVSNSNNLAGLLLPSGTSLQDYKQSLLSNSQNQALLPCPLQTPFFDGTACLSCSVNQYFSSVARVCQTCPAQQTYNAQTYHCETISYYSNPDVKLWTSIATPPSEILKKIANTSTQVNAKPCPTATPYFNGQTCVSCSNPTPIFSYDALKCTSCVAPSVFNPNLYSCVSPQRMQTNPTTAQNLVMEGRSLNEWKTYYFNNQTADPQISDCSNSKPFFDGISCISCPAETPYFNMQYRVCQNCPKDTAYDSAVRECLSTTGNIVTQEPNILKMAAGIFA